MQVSRSTLRLIGKSWRSTGKPVFRIRIMDWRFKYFEVSPNDGQMKEFRTSVHATGSWRNGKEYVIGIAGNVPRTFQKFMALHEFLVFKGNTGDTAARIEMNAASEELSEEEYDQYIALRHSFFAELLKRIDDGEIVHAQGDVSAIVTANKEFASMYRRLQSARTSQ